MIAKLIQRLLAGAAVIVLLVAICLALLRAVPGGPFDSERIAAPEIQAALAARYGTDQSYALQLGNYLKNALHGDFGPSFQYADFNVGELLAQALPITLLLGGMGLALAWMGAIPVALLATRHPGGKIDQAVRLLSTGLLATPKFVVAPMLALVFAVWLKWLPSAGLGEPMLKFLILPALALALTQFGVAVRVLRESLMGAHQSDALKAAKARGFSSARQRWRHALPIALPTALAFLLPSALAVLTGSAVVEQVFTLPGLGRALVQSALNRDYTLLLGVVAVSGVIVMVVGWLIEMLLMALDPRRRI